VIHGEDAVSGGAVRWISLNAIFGARQGGRSRPVPDQPASTTTAVTVRRCTSSIN